MFCLICEIGWPSDHKDSSTKCPDCGEEGEVGDVTSLVQKQQYSAYTGSYSGRFWNI